MDCSCSLPVSARQRRTRDSEYLGRAGGSRLLQSSKPVSKSTQFRFLSSETQPLCLRRHGTFRVSSLIYSRLWICQIHFSSNGFVPISNRCLQRTRSL